MSDIQPYGIFLKNTPPEYSNRSLLTYFHLYYTNGCNAITHVEFSYGILL